MSEPGGEVIISQGPAATIATLIGDIDMINAAEVRAALAGAVDTTSAAVVVVDLSGVTFLGSTGLALLVDAHAAATEAGLNLCLVTGDNRVVIRPLQISHLDHTIPTFATLNQAAAALAVEAPVEREDDDPGEAPPAD